MPFYGVPKTANFAATSGSNAGVYKLFFQARPLAVPKIFFGIRLEYFDRGAKPCSFHRPPDALRRLCPVSFGYKRNGVVLL